MEATRLPNVTVQVLPLSAGPSPGLNGSFSLFSFGAELDEFAYVEDQIGQTFEADLLTVQRCRTAFETLAKRALTQRNAAFLPTFLHAMRTSADQVRRGEVSGVPYPGRSPEEIFELLYADDETDFRQQFWLLHWDETVDNLISYLWADGDELVLVFRFWRPTHPFPEELSRTFVARIPADEFATVLTEAADFMAADLPR